MLFKSKGCVACHTIGTKVADPVHEGVATKFVDQTDAETEFAQRTKNDSQGAQGPTPMPPNAVSNDEIQTLAEWALSQK